MSLIIQKFGGTSLATSESRRMVIGKIVDARDTYDEVVVIVSAMGRLGAPYSTDTLLSLLDEDGRHVDEREIDMLIGCGEIITTVVISNSLQARGINAEALTGGGSGILTSSHFSNARVVDISTDRLIRILEERKIPVIAGFQGRDDKGDITTLGRGGSDTSAVLIGEALSADVVEIYTDVDGIMTADPNVCDNAKHITHISYDEVFQMADSGAKVIHPEAVEVARRAGMKMVIKNTFSDSEGTCISGYEAIERKITANDDRVITSIAHRNNRIQFTVDGHMDDEAFFNALANEGVSIDIINIFPGKRVFTTESEQKEKTIHIIKGFKASFTYIDDCSKVTVIGEKMTGVPGIMAKIVSSLSSLDVEILQTADSLSTIACLVHSKDLRKSVDALHKTFNLH